MRLLSDEPDINDVVIEHEYELKVYDKRRKGSINQN